jgi:hypothetical protein
MGMIHGGWLSAKMQNSAISCQRHIVPAGGILYNLLITQDTGDSILHHSDRGSIQCWMASNAGLKGTVPRHAPNRK